MCYDEFINFSRGYTSACACRFVYICMSSFAKNKIIISLVLFSVVIFSLSNSVMGAIR